MTSGADGKTADTTRANKKEDVDKGKSSKSAILAVPEKDVARLMLADSSGNVRLALRGADPPQAAAANEDTSHYLRLADMASPGAPRPRLVYPVPEPGGLGVHVTLDMGGQARFGPDVEWVDRIDYNVDPRRAGTSPGR